MHIIHTRTRPYLQRKLVWDSTAASSAVFSACESADWSFCCTMLARALVGRRGSKLVARRSTTTLLLRCGATTSVFSADIETEELPPREHTQRSSSRAFAWLSNKATLWLKSTYLTSSNLTKLLLKCIIQSHELGLDVKDELERPLAR